MSQEIQTPATSAGSPPPAGTPPNDDSKLWTYNKWFGYLRRFMLRAVILYLALHILAVLHPLAGKQYRSWDWAYEYMHLDDAANTDISMIYDTARADNSDATVANIEKYIQTAFDDKVEYGNLAALTDYLKDGKTTKQLALNKIKKYSFKIESFFWLTGPEKYLEIIFWSLFGVCCFLLYVIGYKKKTAGNGNQQTEADNTTGDNPAQESFNPDLVDSMIARFWYAPACAIILVLGYNLFRGEDADSITTSKTVIVLSFLVGFFATRMMVFLTRLRDVLLPVDENGAIKNTPVKNPEPGKKTGSVKITITPDDKIDSALLAQLKRDGFRNGTTATLKSGTGSNAALPLLPEGADPVFIFSAEKIPYGDYTANISWKGTVSSGAGEPKQVELAGSQAVSVTENTPADMTITLSSVS